MAVVQISKIQIRRGQKNSSTGVPQLSSAELAWAVDTQELFIGNGSVEEGAPYVGNTKILTEHDNILELASSYRFASDDPSITLSTPRALLGKIDEIEVSVADFGAVGDGSTDCVQAFENAFTQLFRNTDPKYKKVLTVPNGEYLFLSGLEIPSNAIIRGETPTGAILHLDTNNITFVTSTGSVLVDFNSTNRPQNIHISNLTIRRSSGQVVLTGVKDSSFTDVSFVGEYVLGNPVTNISTEPSSVIWSNDIPGIKVENVSFIDCKFHYNSVSLKCNQTIQTDTTMNFSGCDFFVNDTSFYVDGVSGQGNIWQIKDSKFTQIATQIFNSNNGYGTKFQRCNFKECGNGTNTAALPTSTMISFGESRDNLVLDCISDRQQAAGVVASELVDSISEVTNSDYTKLINRNFADIYLTDSFRPIIVVSAFNNFITLNYVLRLGDHVRMGKIDLTIGDDKSKVSLSDEYKYSDATASSPGGLVMTNFEFKAELRDNDSDSGIETIVLFYKNPIATGALGTISFDVSYGV